MSVKQSSNFRYILLLSKCFSVNFQLFWSSNYKLYNMYFRYPYTSFLWFTPVDEIFISLFLERTTAVLTSTENSWLCSYFSLLKFPCLFPPPYLSQQLSSHFTDVNCFYTTCELFLHDTTCGTHGTKKLVIRKIWTLF